MGGLAAEGLDCSPLSRSWPFSEQVENPELRRGQHGGRLRQQQRREGSTRSSSNSVLITGAGDAWQATAADLAAAMATYLEAFLGDSVLPGDYNADGVVDAADYVTWRGSVGGPPGSLPNGIDAGPIDAAHFESWSANYGKESPAGSSVPEPAAIAMAAIALALNAFGRREQRS